MRPIARAIDARLLQARGILEGESVRVTRLAGRARDLAMMVGMGITACADGLPDLEDQVADPNQRAKKPCDTLPESGYRLAEAFDGRLQLEVVDCGLALPSRMRFSPAGDFLLVAQLRGVVEAFLRQGDRFEALESPLYDLGELGVRDEAGLTSIFFGAQFDLDAPEPERRDLFLNYQRRQGRRNQNVIRRVTLARTPDGLEARDPVDIFVAADQTDQAHQIQDGVGLIHEGAPHILVAVGDAKEPDTARDPSGPNGTFQLMRRDGQPPLGERPWPQFPSTHAIGVRNTYGFLHLPAEIDPRRGLVGFDNGNSDIDRAWLVRPFPTSGRPAPLDLGYTGDDFAPSWTEFADPHTRSALGGERRAVFMTFSPPLSPTSVAIHPGGGGIPQTRQGTVSLLVSMFGRSGEQTWTPGKTIDLVTLTNIEGAALQANRRVVVERRPETEGTYRHPVALDVDPVTKDTYFADIITGDLMRLRIVE